MKLTSEELREIAERAENVKKLTETYPIISCNEVEESVTDIPRLLDHIKALEEENAELRDSFLKFIESQKIAIHTIQEFTKGTNNQ